MVKKEKRKKAHLIGICGAGMSALAVLLKESGSKVTGSDNGFYEPVASYLKKNKIYFNKNYSAKNIPRNTDIIVIGKHAELVPSKNEEVKKRVEKILIGVKANLSQNILARKNAENRTSI